MRRLVNTVALSCRGLGLAALLLQAMWWTDLLLSPMPAAFELSMLCATSFAWLLWWAFAGGKTGARLMFFGMVGLVA